MPPRPVNASYTVNACAQLRQRLFGQPQRVAAENLAGVFQDHFQGSDPPPRMALIGRNTVAWVFNGEVYAMRNTDTLPRSFTVPQQNYFGDAGMMQLLYRPPASPHQHEMSMQLYVNAQRLQVLASEEVSPYAARKLAKYATRHVPLPVFSTTDPSAKYYIAPTHLVDLAARFLHAKNVSAHLPGNLFIGVTILSAAHDLPPAAHRIPADIWFARRLSFEHPTSITLEDVSAAFSAADKAIQDHLWDPNTSCDYCARRDLEDILTTLRTVYDLIRSGDGHSKTHQLMRDRDWRHLAQIGAVWALQRTLTWWFVQSYRGTEYVTGLQDLTMSFGDGNHRTRVHHSMAEDYDFHF